MCSFSSLSDTVSSGILFFVQLDKREIEHLISCYVNHNWISYCMQERVKCGLLTLFCEFAVNVTLVTPLLYRKKVHYFLLLNL